MKRLPSETGADESHERQVRRIGPISGEEVAVVPEGLEPYGATMAFSIRSGGCSPAPFDTLNFSASQGDPIENVLSNFSILGKRVGIDPQRIVTCRQVHGDDVAVLDNVPTSLPVADAIITRSPNLYPAIKTADCVPILLLDMNRGIAAAVHAGWRGTVKRITRKVVRFIKSQYGVRPDDLVVGLGPAIGTCCYEVDDTVLTPFYSSFPEPDRFVTRVRMNGGEGNRAHLDLQGANRAELMAEGVPETNILSVSWCTHCHPELLFSYRRDGARSGRHIALVGFQE